MADTATIGDDVLPETAAEQGSVTVCSEESSAANAHWWRIADLGILGIWIALVGFILPYHEKWEDEAQAWLIARDLDLRFIWFHELRYEGSPGLWHTILWIAQHVFHARYDTLGYIGMAGATAGVALLIFKAPFPRYIRWPLAFTYVLVYQYAVIARPYTLLPLLVFAVAILFKDIKHPERIAAVLILLANLTLHGTILAGCFGLAYLIEAYQSRKDLDAAVKRKYWISIGAMALTFLFLFLILKPTPDVEEFVQKEELAKLPAALQDGMPSLGKKLVSIISGGFLDYLWPSILFLVLSAHWCFRRKKLLVFVLGVGSMIAVYGFIHGYAHHQGTAFVAAVGVIWIAWPTKAEAERFNTSERWEQHGMAALLVCLIVINIWDSAVVLKREYLYPYSGAPDAAKYLKSVGADQKPMFGFLMGVVAVQAYFDDNRFANMPTSYFHHGVPVAGNNLDVDELHRVWPEYIVAYSHEPELMMQYGIPLLTAEGYQIVHFSDGYYLYKRGVYERDVYFILRRTGR